MAFRLRDIFFSAFLLLLLSPLFLVLILILKLTQGEVFFSQERTGKDERPFCIHKFASLRPGRSHPDSSHTFTPAGRWLRRLSLNELPQLWNILRGDMSFVGPRPLLHEYLARYSSEQKKRFLVRPGLTGWTQLQGHHLKDWDSRLKSDVWYAEHRTFWLDLKILLRTPFVLIRRMRQGEPEMEEFRG